MIKLIVFAAVVAVAFGAWNGNPQQAQILRSDSDSQPDGSYQWAYDTENGISAQETGIPKGSGGPDPPAVVATGGFQYQSPEGENVQVQYVADENGFQPQGSHIPTPPPIPPAIARAIEWIAAHPQAQEPGQVILARRYR